MTLADRIEQAADAELIHDALRFFFWAVENGIAPAHLEEAPDPEESFFQYSLRTDDENWETVAERYALRAGKERDE